MSQQPVDYLWHWLHSEFCEQPEPGKFKLSVMGDQLVASADRSLRDWALFEGTMLARLVAWAGRFGSARKDPQRAGWYCGTL